MIKKAAAWREGVGKKKKKSRNSGSGRQEEPDQPGQNNYGHCRDYSDRKQRLVISVRERDRQ